MAYRLRQHETIPAGISRIVCEQLDMAMNGFSNLKHDRHECIHATRKALKKTRAILRLVRTELGKVYTTENSRLRDAGRQLAEIRDATARIETLDKMRKLVGDTLEPERFAELRATLVRQREMLAEAVDIEQRIAEVQEALQGARCQVPAWPLRTNSFKAIRPGLTDIYRSGQTTMAHAYAQSTVENFHEWRKRVKDHWYHVRLLRDIWPEMLGSYEAELDRLADHLGDDHDLAVFRMTLQEEGRSIGSEAVIATLLERIDQRQRELRGEAATLGQRIFAERPGKGFATRIQRYYEVWHDSPAIMPEQSG